MGLWVLGAAGVLAVADWVVVARGTRRVEYVLKPLTLLLLLAAAPLVAGTGVGHQLRWTLVALACSLLGDVFLMLPSNRFVQGLGSFLLAHLAYVVAFHPAAPDWARLLPALAAVGAVSALVFGRVRAGLKAKGLDKLVGPVLVYGAVISMMVASAIEFAWRGPGALPAGAAVVGALLFFASDGMIGWSRFVAGFPGARVAIMVTYHLGQAGLVLVLWR